MTAASAAAWAPWALGAVFYCFGFFHRVMPSVMIGELMRDLAIGATAVGTLAAFYFYAYASLQIVVGLIFDRFGARLPLTAACSLAALGTFLFAAAPNVETAYAARLAMGIGGAFSWVGALKLVADGFPPQRFAQLSGLTLLLGLTGAVFGQAPLAALVDAFGWRATAVAAGVFGAGLALAIAMVVRDRRVHESASPIRAREGLRSVLANPQSWVLALYGGAITGPILAFGGLWGVPYVMATYGLDRPRAATVATTMLIGWGVGGPLVGWISDRIGKRRPLLLIGSVLALGSLLGALYIPNLPLGAMQALLFVEGLASGTMVLIFAGAREHNRPEAASVAVGFVNTSGIGAAAILQPVVGMLLDLGWAGEVADGARVYPLAAYAAACGALPIAVALAILAALLVRETHCRNVHGG
jgi:MFS family permease